MAGHHEYDFRTFLLWSPRVLGILLSVFLAMFALDAFSEGKPFVQALPYFAIHLAPAVLLLAIVAASWRWEWVGGLLFVALAVGYGTMVRRLDWILVISGPLLVVGGLFLLSWWFHEERQSPGVHS
jgi:hypothetical protein